MSQVEPASSPRIERAKKRELEAPLTLSAEELEAVAGGMALSVALIDRNTGATLGAVPPPPPPPPVSAKM
ncbi:hypothetical protein CCS01_26260 [Rhodopila globiformis]|uniref:Uncharacterized protein n=2 Tax=Rhodopila globiformis TaxID=1071 RepID=A0A2S6MZC2_RHOGL|nr:hypothetical protein CCS01_26260 [Rhodopila globiformis]